MILVIEDEFGEIKEPKFVFPVLLSLWLIIGIIVFYIDLKKYYYKLQKKRENVDYSD
jgi:hypothetical protein